MRGKRALRSWVVVVAILVLAPAKGTAAGRAISVTAGGDGATGYLGRIGASCGLFRDSFRQTASAELAPGVFTDLPSRLDLAVDVVVPALGSAGLVPGGSHVTLANERGALVLTLDSQQCPSPTLTFDGQRLSGTGNWSVDATASTGAYGGASGSGTYTLDSELTAGADNIWSVSVGGTVQVRQPDVHLGQSSAHWGPVGTGYAAHVATLVLHVANTGAGDAYGVELRAVASRDPGAVVVTQPPVKVGDLAAGRSAEVSVEVALGDRSQNDLVYLERSFEIEVDVSARDGLDEVVAGLQTFTVVTSLFPPPL